MIDQDQMEELNLGLKYNGPQSVWQVYKRTRKYKGGNGLGVIGGEKETNEDTSLRKDIGSADAGPTRPDSLTLDGGSGLKEVAMWDAYAKGANTEGSTSSSIYKSPRSCNAMMAAASTWDFG